MKIQLSISLLASNRIGSLERCLESLKPLLRKISSELIVVFTGKDEKVREVACRYTDQIVPFTWCDDFSAARNAGLQRAKGEWFLYIDDDEWFEDVTEICDFFLSGEYKHYSSAHYIQRNYSDWSGIQYSDFPAYRMVRRLPETRFHNLIHEELIPRFEPIKYFAAYVHHYGYIKEEGNKRNVKVSRNMPILLQDIEKNPSYLKNYVQLVREYYIESNWKKAEEWCRKGYAIAKKNREEYETRWFAVYLAKILCRGADEQQAIDEIIRVLKKENPYELDRLFLYDMLVNLYTGQGMPKEAVKYGLEFEHLVKRMDEKPEIWEKQICGDLSEDNIKALESTLQRQLNSVVSALEIQDLQNAKYFLTLLPWEEEYKLQQYYPLFDTWKELHSPHFQEILAKLPYQSSYLLLQEALKKCEEEGTEKAQELFSKCMEEIEDGYLQLELMKKAILCGIDFSVMLDKMDLTLWQKFAGQVMKEILFKDMEHVRMSLDTSFAKHPLHGFWFRKLLLEKELLQGYLTKGKLTDTLKEYCQCILQFYQGMYKEDMFAEENRNLLPKDCRFAIVTLEALCRIEDNQPVEAVRTLRGALQLLPDMTSVVWEVVRYLQETMTNPALGAGQEFAMLAEQMKASIRVMQEKGQYKEVISVVEQLLPLLPDDLELLRMRQNLLREISAAGK